MKLFLNEYQTISDLFNHHGIPFELDKRKGWLHIRSGSAFIKFHRKKEVKIEQGKFQTHYIYLLDAEGVTHSTSDWNEVLIQLNSWIKQLK